MERSKTIQIGNLKEKLMKRLTLLILAPLLCFSSQAQTVKNKNLRNSISMLVTKYTSNPTSAYYYANELTVPSMFDDNSLNDNTLFVGDYSITDNSSQIEAALQRNKMGQQILKTILYNARTNQYTKEVMFERGAYTATDNDYKIAMDSKKKEYVLKDMGVWLMKNIYVEVVDCKQFIDLKAETYGDYTNEYANVLNSAQQKLLTGTIYLYKLDIDEILEDQSFWNLIDFENNNNEVQKAFDNYNFKFKKINSVPFNITESKTASGALSVISELLKVDNTQPLKTDKQLLTSMLNKATEKSHAILCSSLPNFSIGQGVFDVHPIRIKVGKKESLKANNLYEITEIVEGSEKEQHVAWIRAKKVSENRFVSKGKSTPSTFYKVSGGSIKKGMTASYVPQKGYEVSVGYNEGSSLLSGTFVELTYLGGGIPKTRVGVRGIFGNAKTDVSENIFGVRDKIFFNVSNVNIETFINHTIKIGFIRLIPKVGFYYSMGRIKNYDEKGKTGLPMSDWGVTEDIKLKSWGFTTGAGVGLNLGKNLQLTFRYDYISPLDPPTSSRTLTYFAIPIDPIFNAKGVYGVGLTVLGF